MRCQQNKARPRDTKTKCRDELANFSNDLKASTPNSGTLLHFLGQKLSYPRAALSLLQLDHRREEEREEFESAWESGAKSIGTQVS